MEILRLISALYFTSTKNKILLLDPPPNENSNVSFAPHKTTENTTTFLVFMKNFHLKWEETLKIDRLNCRKSFISNGKKRKENHFNKSNLINFRTRKKSYDYQKQADHAWKISFFIHIMASFCHFSCCWFESIASSSPEAI